MYKDFSEQFADDIRKMMEHFKLPYIEITLHNEHDEDRPTSPLNEISNKMEALVNALLGYVMFAGMEEGSFLLNHFENQIEDLLSLSSYLRLKHEKEKLQNLSKKQIDKIIDKQKEKEIPIPIAFAKALEEIMNKHNLDNQETTDG